jgi:hypothetical protein
MSNVFYCIRDKSVYSGKGKAEEVWGVPDLALKCCQRYAGTSVSREENISFC